MGVGAVRNDGDRRWPWRLALFAGGAAAVVSAGPVHAQSLTVPNYHVTPRITPVAPVMPRITPQIHRYHIQSYQDDQPSAEPQRRPRRQARPHPSRPHRPVVVETRPSLPVKPPLPTPRIAQAGPARGFVPPPNEQRFVPNEVVIELNGSPSTPTVERLAQRHRLRRMESQEFALSNSTFYRWQIPDRRSVRQVVRDLGNDPNIASAQPNYRFTLQQDAAAAAGAPQQYAVRKMELIQAHRIARGDNVRIAVIDSGIDVSHPELAGVIAATFDALQSKEGPHPHGTGIAGLIAARGRLQGVAPAAQILAVRAFGSAGKTAESTTFAILKSLEWSVRRRAQVINMSFAGPSDPAMARSLKAAHDRGIILIAAAGNAGPKSPPLFPGADPNVIAVSATDVDDRLFPNANRGKYVAVTAPGVDVLAPTIGGRYQVASGTSFSAAEVSGIAALLIERRPELSPKAVRTILEQTARDLGPRGPDPEFGAGLVNARRAVTAAAPQSVDTATTATPAQLER